MNVLHGLLLEDAECDGAEVTQHFILKILAKTFTNSSTAALAQPWQPRSVAGVADAAAMASAAEPSDSGAGAAGGRAMSSRLARSISVSRRSV